jgi:hypothetical protein
MNLFGDAGRRMAGALTNLTFMGTEVLVAYLGKTAVDEFERLLTNWGEIWDETDVNAISIPREDSHEVLECLPTAAN